MLNRGMYIMEGVFVNSKYLKLEGAAYKSNSDIEAFIQEKMNGIQ